MTLSEADQNDTAHTIHIPTPKLSLLNPRNSPVIFFNTILHAKVCVTFLLHPNTSTYYFLRILTSYSEWFIAHCTLGVNGNSKVV